jgi:maltose alpha-D-glucosyltransferase/alpha-amylase
MRLNNGIRRRLAPLLGNDLAKIELAHALLLSLPGTPVMYYGDEIGMGDDLTMDDRDGLRTPMQWSDAPHGGFSPVADVVPVLPVIDNAAFGYRRVNVAAQERADTSLLARIRRLIAVRHKHPAFGRGDIEFVQTGRPSALAFLRRYRDEVLLIVANLAASGQEAPIPLPPASAGTSVIDLVDGARLEHAGPDPRVVSLDPHRCRWFRLEPSPQCAADPRRIRDPHPKSR